MKRFSSLKVKGLSRHSIGLKRTSKRDSSLLSNGQDEVEANGSMGYSFRLQNIPSDSAPDVITEFFEKRGCSNAKLLSLTPSATSPQDSTPDLTAVFTVPIASMKSFEAAVSETSMEADDDFCGFTPLYQPPEPAVIDFVAVPGLACNSFETWTSEDEASNGIWLQNRLPRHVSKARILLYGHDYDQHRGDFGLIESLATRLRNDLLALHRASDDKGRPIVLLAHSTGCLIVKKALCQLPELIDKGVLQFVTFLGAPHEGLDAVSFRILADLQASQTEAREFMHGSAEIEGLNTAFAPVAEKLNISAFYEVRNTVFLAQNRTEDGLAEDTPTGTLLVPKTSATQFGRTEISADADHFGLAQIVEDDKHFGAICDILLSVINIRLKPGGWKVPTERSAWYLAPAFNAFTGVMDEDAVTESEKSTGTAKPLSTRQKMLHSISIHQTQIAEGRHAVPEDDESRLKGV